MRSASSYIEVAFTGRTHAKLSCTSADCVAGKILFDTCLVLRVMIPDCNLIVMLA
jgi:hypothetical protein